MSEQDITSNMSFWMWVLSGISGVITTLILVIFKSTNAKIDGAYAGANRKLGLDRNVIY